MARLLGRCCVPPSLAELLISCRNGPTLFYPMHELRLNHTDYLALQSVIRLVPSPVRALVWSGQNTADRWSRQSTRNMDQTAEAFESFIRRNIESLEQRLGDLGMDDVTWVVPFDDSRAQFTPLYLALVERLRVAFSQKATLSLSEPVAFEDDHYHLRPSSRVALAFEICSLLDPPCEPCGPPSTELNKEGRFPIGRFSPPHSEVDCL